MSKSLIDFATRVGHGSVRPASNRLVSSIGTTTVIKKTATHNPTANTMAGDREQYLAGGMNDYVSKPIDAAALFAAIARVSAPKEAGVAAIEPVATAAHG